MNRTLVFLSGFAVAMGVTATAGALLHERGTLVIGLYKASAGVVATNPGQDVLLSSLDGSDYPESTGGETGADGYDLSEELPYDEAPYEEEVESAPQTDPRAFDKGRMFGNSSVTQGNPDFFCQANARSFYRNDPLGQANYLQGCLLVATGGDTWP